MGRCILHRFRPDSPDKTLRSNEHGEEELRGVEATGPKRLGEGDLLVGCCSPSAPPAYTTDLLSTSPILLHFIPP
jgi:hypothetical protein